MSKNAKFLSDLVLMSQTTAFSPWEVIVATLVAKNIGYFKILMLYTLLKFSHFILAATASFPSYTFWHKLMSLSQRSLVVLVLV